LLCLLSGRGALSLTIENIVAGGVSQGGCLCPLDERHGCFVATGEGWLAAGIGFCEPESWTTWQERWWDDDWCYCAGAWIGVSLMVPGGLGLDVELDAE
jgi:hypothetical protein